MARSREISKAQFIEPIQCRPVERLPEGKDWEYEVKLDGYRTLGIKTDGRVRLVSRNGNDVGERFPQLVHGLDNLPDETIVDGEIVALDKTGRPSFNRLQNFRNARTVIEYYAFDLLNIGGKWLLEQTVRRRRE